MGGCVGTTRRRRDGSGSRRPSAAFSDSTSDPDSVSTKNRPLRHEKVRRIYKSRKRYKFKLAVAIKLRL